MKEMLAIILLSAQIFENSAFAIEFPNGEIPMKECDDPTFNPSQNNCATIQLKLSFRKSSYWEETVPYRQCEQRYRNSVNPLFVGNAEVYDWAKNKCAGLEAKVHFSLGFDCQVLKEKLGQSASQELIDQTQASKKPLILPVRVACFQNKR